MRLKVLLMSVAALVLFSSCGILRKKTVIPEPESVSESTEARYDFTPNNPYYVGLPSYIQNDTHIILNRTTYTVGYNPKANIPNYTTWHLDSTYFGDTQRSRYFFNDTLLPEQYYVVKYYDYKYSGFNRGHLCPSGERTANEEMNKETFLMTNMIPQSPTNNQKTWNGLEDYERALAKAGLELYIVAGAYGTGGVGDKGYATYIGPGIRVPAQTYKILIVLPIGDNDVKRVDSNTTIIAVDMPNSNMDSIFNLLPNYSIRDWQYYSTTIAEIEKKTGYKFFNKIPAKYRDYLINKKFEFKPVETLIDEIRKKENE
jgi:endonuclease G